MSKEFEAKFLDINVSEMKKKLKLLGAKPVHPRKKYVRSVYHRCAGSGFARVRREDKGVTMTVKTYDDPKFPHEFEVSINEDFDTAVKFMNALGIKQKAFQESYREKWKHPLVNEVTFDNIPGIPTYMEVEAETEEKMNQMIDMLKLDKSKMRFGSFDRTYEEYYGIPRNVLNDETPSLTFAKITSEIKPTKNQKLLLEVAAAQKKMGLITGGNVKKRAVKKRAVKKRAVRK
jgi:adenylate cyclase class 2